MYAVIKSGGKQYRVTEGDIVKLETLPAEEGSKINFDNILMFADGENVKVGAPTVAGAKVSGTVVEHGRHKKIRIIKFRRRKHHRKQMGHRQNYTAVKIEKISA